MFNPITRMFDHIADYCYQRERTIRFFRGKD